MGEKECHRHHHKHRRCCCECSCDFSYFCDFFDDCHWSKLRVISYAIGAFVLLILLTFFITWVVLRPTSPTFYIKDAVVHYFNLSLSDNLLSTEIQPTLCSHNPNGRVGVFYDSVRVFAIYQNQQITLPTPVAPFYQGHGDVNLLSPILAGDSVTVAPGLCHALGRDEEAGFLLLYVKINGKVRWKVGRWTSGEWRIEVNCPAVFSFSSRSDGVAVVQFQQIAACSFTP